jgi:hypothetical protein
MQLLSGLRIAGISKEFLVLLVLVDMEQAQGVASLARDPVK